MTTASAVQLPRLVGLTPRQTADALATLGFPVRPGFIYPEYAVPGLSLDPSTFSDTAWERCTEVHVALEPHGGRIIAVEAVDCDAPQTLSRLLGPPTATTATAYGADGRPNPNGFFYSWWIAPAPETPWPSWMLSNPGRHVPAMRGMYTSMTVTSVVEVGGPIHDIGEGHPFHDLMLLLNGREDYVPGDPYRYDAEPPIPPGEDALTPEEQWASEIEWDELLTEAGFVETGGGSCGCSIYRHPWGASSDRSVIAHVEGCPDSRSERVGGVLHAFSAEVVDRLGRKETVGKLWFLAHIWHDGDLRAAREAEGIPPDPRFEKKRTSKPHKPFRAPYGGLYGGLYAGLSARLIQPL